MNDHVCYLSANANNMSEASRITCLLSQNSLSKYGGFYIAKNNIRKSVVLFSIRSLPKHTWINDPDTFIVSEKNDLLVW